MIVAVIRRTQTMGISFRLLAPTLTATAAIAHKPSVAPANTQERVVPGGQVGRGELRDVAPLGDEHHAEAGRGHPRERRDPPALAERVGAIPVLRPEAGHPQVRRAGQEQASDHDAGHAVRERGEQPPGGDGYLGTWRKAPADLG